MEVVLANIKNDSYFNDQLTYVNSCISIRGITPNELHFLALLYTEDVAALYKCWDSMEHIGKVLLTRGEAGELYQKDLITERWTSNSDYPDNCKLTDSGKELIKLVYNIRSSVKQEQVFKPIDNTIRFGAELCDAYPEFWDRQYQAQSFKAVIDKNMRKIDGRADLYNYYFEVIKGNEQLHKEIISKIEWAKKQNAPDNTIPKIPEIRQSIMNFVVLRAWEKIKITDSKQKGI